MWGPREGAMGLVRRGYLSISEAYEKIVVTLEPHARPSDDYLLSLDEDERDADFDSAHDAEKRAEKLFADALVPFELSSALLMVAVVGAIAVARGRQGLSALSRGETAIVRESQEEGP